MATITVNGNTIAPKDPQRISQDAKKTNFIYIQGHKDFTAEEKSQLAKLEVEIQEYVAEFTYLCRFEPQNIQKLQALPFVRAANVYHNSLKATVSLKYLMETEVDQEEYEVDLVLHDKPNVDAIRLAPFVAAVSGVPLEQLEILSTKIRLTVHQDKLAGLAALDSVNRIEEVRQKELYNDQARIVLHTDTINTSSKYQGSTETICVADTGFDQGLATDTDEIKIHPAFTGRIDHLRSLWIKDSARDPIGHGTHVCGSICGNGVYTPSPTSSQLPIKGTAPAAKLMVQALSAWSPARKKFILKAPAEITQLFTEPYALGIRIHNNSWGDSWAPAIGQLGYDSEATAIDKFVREHEDFVVLVAAGNHANAKNHGDSQIGDNSAAKNCITVGATGSLRPNDGQRMRAVATPAGTQISETAVFSSRGPTKASLNSQGEAVIGRIKPDVVAPGVAILSSASRALKGDDYTRVMYGVSGDRDWLFMSGTSMATPLVAGCVALIREALKGRGKMRPSAALVKAVLVNGAVNCTDRTGRGFDYEQGFGRADVERSIALVEGERCAGFVDGGSGLEDGEFDVGGLLQSGQWQSGEIPVPEGRNAFVATLVYSDGHHALLQNDINLIVRAGGVERHGNMGSSLELDHTNNVERVVWDDIPGDKVTVIVKPYAFLKPWVEQSFAVVWSFRTIE